MSSVQQLTSDVTSLSTEAKRRNNDIRQACDRALVVLKGYTPTQSISSPDFVPNSHDREALAKPFMLSLTHGNVKFATIAIPVLHRLIGALVVPSLALPELLESLSEAANLAVDIQLRILQCLPSVMQVYGEHIQGDLLLKLLSICSSLTANNKSTVVINTALATLQQLFSFVFDGIREESSTSSTSLTPITIDNAEVVQVSARSLEGFRIFEDLCRLASQERPEYLPPSMHIRSLSVLELIESIVASHRATFHTHRELGYLLRQRVIPTLLRALNSTGKSFQMTVRVLRIIQVLLGTQLDIVEVESEVILTFLNHILSSNDLVRTENGDLLEVHDWEQLLILEMFRNLFRDFLTVRAIFEKYDEREESRNIIQDLSSTFNLYLQRNPPKTTDILKPLQTSSLPDPTGHSNGNSNSNNLNSISYLSRQTSNMKVSILDHLDKHDPPLVIPPTYAQYLIFNILLVFSEGVAKFVTNISNGGTTANPEILEKDVDFISSIIETTYPDIAQLYEVYLFSTMDNETFHQLIRSLQKFTHTAGLLGLGSLRDGLLLLISRAIIKIDIPEESSSSTPTNATSSSLHEQGKNLLAFGESIVESLGGGSNDSPTYSNALLKPRRFNSRHVTCFRALVNLAVSLGSTLDQSWKIIWITFQWCNYYIQGPDELSGQLNNKSRDSSRENLTPKLTAADLTSLDNSKKKLYESIKEYPKASIHNLISALSSLSDRLFVDPREEEKFEAVISSAQDLQVCPYNRSYYMSKISEVLSVNSRQFIINDDNTWKLVSDYFIRNSINRSMSFNSRIHTVKSYLQVIQTITADGFAIEDVKMNNATAEKSLQGLLALLNGLYNLGAPLELLVINCETEIDLLSLTTLHQLIDHYDKFYQHSWETVFEILNTPFKAGRSDANDKAKLLLNSSFETLKLILDEFIFSLPFAQLKILIDTLFNFSMQTTDLNISFSAVSYFWLVSDSIKSKLQGKSEGKTQISTEINKEEELVAQIESAHDSDDRYQYELLDVYLLLSLSKISTDSRAQVRDGAIQTFFQIIEVHGNLLRSWRLIYDLVLPNLLNIELDILNEKFNKKEWIESLNLILSGLVSLYLSFMMDFDNDATTATYFWKGHVQYYQRLLDLRWIDLNVIIFTSFHDCLVSFEKVNVTGEIRKLLYDFWIQIPIEYDFINPLFQESLTKLMTCFPPLYHLVRDTLTVEEANSILNNFNSCARYPVLQANYSDNVKPSSLQLVVLENFRLFDLKDSRTSSNVIQQLSSILVYPFATRARIEQKLGSTKLNGKLKIPTFIAISSLSLGMLEDKIDKLDDFSILIKDKGILKLMKSLIEVVKEKFQGIEKNEVPLWVDASNVLKKVIIKIFDLEPGEIQTELWVLIFTTMQLCFDTVDKSYETATIGQYFDLSKIVFPQLSIAGASDELVKGFVKEIYTNSFLFEANELEKSLDSLSIVEYSEKLAQFDFELSFGTTEPLRATRKKQTAVVCLRELVKFSSSTDTSVLKQTSLDYFVCRLAFSLRRFIADATLLSRAPLPQIQQDELRIIMEGILQVVEVFKGDGERLAKVKTLYPLVTKTISLTSKIKGLDVLVEKVLSR